jgi:hypothetical protein
MKLIWCGMAVKRVGMLSVRKMMALSGKGSQNVTRFVYYLYVINSKIFFLTRHFYSWGGVLDLDKYIFCW